MQAYMRGLLARKQTRSLRQQKAAVNIQTAWRRYKMRQQYNLVLHNITAVQVCRHTVLAMLWGLLLLLLVTCVDVLPHCKKCMCLHYQQSANCAQTSCANRADFCRAMGAATSVVGD